MVLLVLLPLCPQGADSTVVSTPPSLLDGTGLLYANRVEGATILDPRAIWSPVRVKFNCSTAAYHVLTARSFEELTSPASATKVLWCGWRNILSEPNVCQLQFSMFRTTHFAVKPAQGSLLSLGQPALTCDMEVDNSLGTDVAEGAAVTLAALALFFHADRLSRSTAFRLSSGGLLGMTGMAVILLLIVIRNAPAKRAVTAGFLISASGMVGIVRWAFGTWAPGVRAVIYSRVGVWYALITGAAGVAVTYWLDNPDNYKINTSIRVALQGMALGAVYWSIADETLAVAAVATIMTFGWLSAFLRHLYAALALLSRAISWLCLQLGLFVGPPRAVPVGPADVALKYPLLYDEPSYNSDEDDDYTPEPDELDSPRGIATEPEDEGDDEDYDSSGGEEEQEEERQPVRRADLAPAQAAAPAHAPASAGAEAGAAGGRPAGWLGWWQPAARAAAGGVAGAAAVGADEELDPAPSFAQWAAGGGGQQSRQQQGRPQGQGIAAHAAAQAGLAGAGAAGDAGAGRAPGPSPGGWGQTLLAVDRTQGTNHQQQPAAQQRPSSASPWSERKVVDLTKPRTPPGVSPTATAAPGSSRPSLPAAVSAGAGTAAGATPKSRKVLNPETGRDIVVNGATYRELLARGWQYNSMTDSLEFAGQSPAAAAVLPASRGAPTPASNLRSRRTSKM